ncbi:MAG TPA: glycosyltransferase family 4 protein, partial [Acidimicrobiales bacterium]|nr:glycosyltransferase family 4 protein [Acidimicrobiales bacterium]
ATSGAGSRGRAEGASASDPEVRAPIVGSHHDIASIAARAGLHRIHILAWRDLDDPEAGGSELHASTIARIWAQAGLDVTMRSSAAAGHPAYARRDGYRVVRKSGRYAVFPRTALSGLVGRTGERDALVEVWNGMPFFSPAWARCPRVVFLHHVHAEMWRMVLKPEILARVGEMVEFRVAPPVYRRSRIVTLSSSSKQEIVDMLGLPERNISVVSPGVSPRFSPGGTRSPHPLVVAAGRLVPVKRFDMLIDTLVELRRRHPGLEAVIVGEGYERPALEARIRAADAAGWLSLPGHLSDADLLALYRRAWVLASTSLREGWGMTVTEAAACGTPSVVTRIAGHLDAVEHGASGFLADGPELADHLDLVLRDEALRRRLQKGAIELASRFTWEATARGTLEVLASSAEARRRR